MRPQRFEQRGYSRSEFVLRMTRAEIGSYLGLKLETVSRVLSRFSHDNLIIVNQKHVQILDFEGLRAIVSGQAYQHGHAQHGHEHAAGTQDSRTGTAEHRQVPILRGRRSIDELLADDQ